jgi:hypothetical protein
VPPRDVCSFEEIFDRICLELSLSGQQRLQDIRGRTSVPRIVSFGPAAPSRYSRQDFGPSNCLFRASSTFKIFEAGLRSLELLLSGQQRLQDIRGRASVPRIFFGSAVPSNYSRSGFDPSNCLFWPSNAFKEFELELRTFESSFSSLSLELSALLVQHAQILGAIYQFGCRMSNTKVSPWFQYRMARYSYQTRSTRNFPYLRYEVCTDGRIRCLTNELGSDLVSPTQLGSG